MDPLTQGVLGAALPAATRRARQVRVAAAVGFLAGLAADVDVVIRSPVDGLLFLEYHRQFTHSLVFIPVGGLVVAALVALVFRRRLATGFPALWLIATLGYATHGLIDAATSYGTQLFWPFTDQRVAFSIISIVDPAFTLPILVLVALSAVRRTPTWARLALVWAIGWLALGAVQHQSARGLAADLAAARGHVPDRLEVKPSFGNLLVWRSIYLAEGRFFVDAIRPGYAEPVIDGTSAERLDVPRAFPWLDPQSQQARDIERFTWFSDGFVALAPGDDRRVIDVRYAFLPNGIAPLWSIRLDPAAGPTDHARYETHRDGARDSLAELLSMLLGRPARPDGAAP